MAQIIVEIIQWLKGNTDSLRQEPPLSVLNTPVFCTVTQAAPHFKCRPLGAALQPALRHGLHPLQLSE